MGGELPEVERLVRAPKFHEEQCFLEIDEDGRVSQWRGWHLPSRHTMTAKEPREDSAEDGTALRRVGDAKGSVEVGL